MRADAFADAFIDRILDDPGLTAGLNDPEARLLVEWLVDQAERLAAQGSVASEARKCLEALCHRVRSIRSFVVLWCHRGDQGAASQLAAAERFPWPLPSSIERDPCEILEQILLWEQHEAREGRQNTAA